MRDQTVVADAELALHPTIFVDFRVERARRQRRELARGPFEIDHCACGLELLPGGRAYGREALLLSSTIIAGAPPQPATLRYRVATRFASRLPAAQRRSLGRASLMRRARPPRSFPLSCATAASASLWFGISTNPKPRDRPVSRSTRTFAEDTSPKAPKASRSWPSVMP